MAILQYKFFSKQQERIYNGLKEIGPTLANFYADAIAMMQPDCFVASKTNFIAHMAREIDGGLRDVFAPIEVKKEKQKIIGATKKDHLASILAAIGKDDPDDDLAKEWFNIATQFPGVAHRYQIHGPSRAIDDIKELWDRYEQILLVLIGSFYAITQRLDKFFLLKTAPTDSLPALQNILKNEKHRAYFFSKLNEPGWLPGLQTDGYFDLTHAPVPTGDPAVILEWWELRYLSNISKIKSSGQEASLKSIVDSILAAYIDGKVILHPFSIATLAEIIVHLDGYGFSENERKFFETVAERSADHDLFFTQTLLDGIMPKLFSRSDSKGILEILKFVFGFSTYQEPQFDFFSGDETAPITRRKPNIDQFQVDHFVSQYGTRVMGLVGEDAISLVTGNIRRLENIGNFEFDFMSMSSIEDTDQTIMSNGWDRSVSNFIRDYAGLLPVQVLGKFLEEWLYLKQSILQRLAIHLTGIKFSEQSQKWWEFVNSNTGRPFIHEPYVLLKKTSPQYTVEQMQTILNWIEKITTVHQMEGQTEENALANRNYNVRRWLSALSSEIPAAKELLDRKKQEYDTLNNWKIEHPEYDSYSTTHFGYDMPEGMPDFIKMEVSQQIEFIQNYKPSDSEPTGDEGTAQVLTQLAAQNPEKYLFNLDAFLPLPSVYSEGLLDGLKTALSQGKLASFMSVISFSEKKIIESSFLSEPATGYKSRRGFIYRLADFIRVIASSDILEITAEQVNVILQLLITLIENTDFQDNDEKVLMGGYIDHSFNSLSGRLHSTLLEICRLYAMKFTKKEDKVKWPQIAQQYFTKHLSRTGNAAKDYSIVLGSRLTLVLYLDKEWVQKNFDLIFYAKDEQQFEYTFGSSISQLYQPDQGLYKLFKERGLFNTALERYKDNDGRLNRVMQYAMLEWQAWSVAADDENSIVNAVLKKRIPSQYLDLIEVFEREKLIDYELVKTLWKKILTAIGTDKNFDSVLGYLLSLADHAKSLDTETCDLIFETICKIEKESRSVIIFTRKIYNLADTNLEKAALIVLQLFEKNITKPYHDRELSAFVRKLYTGGFRDKAIAICIAVSDTGSFALKDIYDEFNK